MRTAGRRITLLGFLLLSICFFLPQIKGCSTPIVPAKEVWDGHAVDWLLSFFAPFVFGFLGLAVYAVVNLIRRVKFERALAILWCILCAAFLCAVSVKCVQEWGGSGSDTPLEGRIATAGVIVTMALVVVAASRARPFRRMPLCTLCCGTASLAYFLSWIVEARFWRDLYYGIWLSATASLLIAVGALMDCLAPPRQLVPSIEL